MSAPLPATTLQPFDLKMIRHKAKQLCRAGVPSSDRDDVAQELTLHLLERLHQYDPKRSKRHTFVVTVLDQQVATILESYGRLKRQGSKRHSFDEVVAEEDGVEIQLGETIPEVDRLLQRGVRTCDPHRHAEMKIDIADVVSTLPDLLRDICSRLRSVPSTVVQRDLGISSHEMRKALRKIRLHFEKAGLDCYL